MNPDVLATLHAHLLTALADAPTETRRLFHGRGRCWPGLEQLTVDWLQGVVLVALFKEPEPAQLDAFKLWLSTFEWARYGVRSVALQHRYLPQSTTEWLFGEAVDALTITEGGLRYLIDLGKKQNSGLFLDMRYGRNWVREQAKGQRVLNLFAYTCGFSVAAIEGGAEHVVNLDMARGALSRGRDNHRLNGHDLGKVTFLGHDLFKSWAKVTNSGPYDLVIIDPPSFQKGSFLLTKDYQRVLRRLPDLLTAQGTVLACMNDPAFGEDFLIDSVTREAPGLRFIERLQNPPEFPDIDAQSGLKALVFRQG
ncbi:MULTISPECIES: class I SAM-dependent methyltransferase [unclassified Pseudomonas]|uniref:class I SAM-dependent methyltransferase n=1 Tax=unclassified Pseudomonas TaxID=196821 RepID=UPI000C88CF2C|nr:MULTISPECIES: class I SAM-dependent methyltransferase [unclassified Pseudomonas]PMX13943.1 methyltransferase [Pseudomonas sp. GW460-12]PMX29029.1 methyltransferase [Pseudomonas sp. MPR-R2A4]PMX41810.1 methyltransferase [Pseudomonas sp. MPR-R2A7]PMX46683.1 methyltransferase [Pseudomonas sp. MPR-R2A6]PMX81591.1 methyltransferase [Pseudomonas sp. MPR-R2A3]